MTKFVPRAVILDLATHQDIIGGIISNPMKKRDLVIIFVDLEGSTELCERVPPEAMTAILNQYFLRFGTVITKNGGTIDKYLGDGIMAIFGAPHHIDNQEIKACLSALEFAKAMEEVCARANQPALKYRVGIHSGETLFGTIGYIERFNWTVVGRVPSIAARIEHLGKKYHITPILSGQVVKGLRDTFVCILIDITHVRGSSQWIDIYHLRGKTAEITAQDIAIMQGFERMHNALRAGDGAHAANLSAEMKKDETFAEYHHVFARLESHNFITPEAYEAVDM